jgi:transposase
VGRVSAGSHVVIGYGVGQGVGATVRVRGGAGGGFRHGEACVPLRYVSRLAVLRNQGFAHIPLLPSPALAAMPLVTEMVHPCGLDFANQRKAAILRDRGESFASIAAQVKNLKGKPTSVNTVRRICANLDKKAGRKKYQYKKSGRKPYKITADIRKHLEKLLLKMRRDGPAGADALRRALVREKGVELEVTTIRKELRKLGYFWLPRAQKRLYSPADKAARLAFAQAAVRMSQSQLREKLSFAMDGVILSMPPDDVVGRANFCKETEVKMWRKRDEVALPALAGGERYPKQVPLNRAVPLWGGLSEGGFAIVLFHDQKKLNAEAWAETVDNGNLTSAIKSLKPRSRNGPWHVLCDNESFLTARDCARAHRAAKIQLWQIPPRSPDLNPVERFWGWLRNRLRARDRADLKAKRPALTKAAYRARVQAICRTKHAQKVAKKFAQVFRKVCEEVVAKQGAASRM